VAVVDVEMEAEAEAEAEAELQWIVDEGIEAAVIIMFPDVFFRQTG
jgi:hypothetical protein